MSVEVAVVTAALRNEATTWGDQAAAIGQVGDNAEGLRLNYLTAGIFAPIVADYEAAVDQISQRCAEGREQMSAIDSALRRNADAYDLRDEDVAAHVEGAY